MRKRLLLVVSTLGIVGCAGSVSSPPPGSSSAGPVGQASIRSVSSVVAPTGRTSGLTVSADSVNFAHGQLPALGLANGHDAFKVIGMHVCTWAPTR
jgi:hypothetical protein